MQSLSLLAGGSRWSRLRALQPTACFVISVLWAACCCSAQDSSPSIPVISAMSDERLKGEEETSISRFDRVYIGAAIVVFVFCCCAALVGVNHLRNPHWLANVEQGCCPGQVLGRCDEALEDSFPETPAASESLCSICLESVSVSQPCRILQCKHAFHSGCILEWWKRRPSDEFLCPCCKTAQSMPSGAALGVPLPVPL